MAKSEKTAETESNQGQDGPKLVKKPEAEQKAKEGGGTRAVMIKDPDTGEEVKRVDWIRKVFQDPNSPYFCNRGEIAKKLTEIQGKTVPYQIVFAATRDFKVEKPPKPAKEASEKGQPSQPADPLAGAEGADA